MSTGRQAKTTGSERGTVSARATPAAPLVVSLDIGTSSIRGTVHDATGQPVPGLRVVRRQDGCLDQNGASELDADRAVEQAVQVLEETARLLPAPPAAVAMATLWHSLVGVDGRGRAVTPVSLWADRRAATQARTLQEHLDPRTVLARTGCPIHPSYPLARILWLKETYPDEFARIHRFLALGDYLIFRLFGEPVTSPSLASGWGLFDLVRNVWDGELTALVGVTTDHLPFVLHERLWQGRLRSPYRERLVRLQGVPWLLPVGDGAADSVGAGSYLPGRVTVMMGSSGATRLIRPGPAASLLPPAPGLWTYLVRDDLPVTGGSLSNGGKLVEWALRTLRVDAGGPDGPTDVLWATLDRALRERPPDAHGLTVLPFWAGERSPGWHLDAAGTLMGLRLTTSPVDIVQAVLEAIAYRVAVIHRRLRDGGVLSGVYTVAATGSALTCLPAWMQVVADVLGVPVVRLAVDETTARGSALLALDALGLAEIATSPFPETAARYEPNEVHHATYFEAIRRQEAAYKKAFSEPPCLEHPQAVARSGASGSDQEWMSGA